MEILSDARWHRSSVHTSRPSHSHSVRYSTCSSLSLKIYNAANCPNFQGWVSYSISAVTTALGENRLMPAPDFQCKVINADNGYTRDNRSWVIGRIVRDFENWMDDGNTESGAIHSELRKILQEKRDQQAVEGKGDPANKEIERPLQTGLCVSVYTALEARPAFSSRDLPYWTGVAVIVLQLGIAVILFGLYGDWGIFFITGAGTLLALITGSWPQWTREKWACRKKARNDYILTRGNGAQHALLILGTKGEGLDLEDLAGGSTNMNKRDFAPSRIITVVMAVMWVVLLITASGIKQHSWYLLAVGSLGMLQNIFIAGWPRRPQDFGIPLHFEEVIGRVKVMQTLYAVEEKYPRAGRSMRDTFFPARLWPDEIQKWEEYEAKAVQLEEEKKKKKNVTGIPQQGM